MLKEGIYEQIINEKLKQELSRDTAEMFEIGKEKLDVEEARKILSSYISHVTRKALSYIRDHEAKDEESLLNQIQTCNDIIALLSDKLDEDEFKELQIDEQGEVLTSIYSKINSVRGIQQTEVIRPVTPISQSSLFTGSKYEPNMLGELKKEIVSADSIDMLVSFIKWSGIRIILEELEKFTEKGGQLQHFPSEKATTLVVV